MGPKSERASPGAAAVVRVGLAGCGTIGSSVHLPLLAALPGCRVVAVADPSPAARARAAGIAPVETLADAAELPARDDVDAVVVCSPSATHAALALAALSAGKHLYLEKPIATTAADARAVVAAAAGRGLVAAAGFNLRFHPLAGRLRAAVRSGEVVPEAVASTFREPVRPWRLPAWRRRREEGGGVLLDLASHHVDLVRWLLEDEIVEVAAEVRRGATDADEARIRLRTARGVAGTSWFSYRSGRADVVELAGGGARLRLDRYGGRLDRLDGEAGAASPGRGPRLAARVRGLSRRPEPSYGLALAAFVDAVRGVTVELPSLEDGLRSLEVVLAAHAAAASGRPERLDGAG